MPKNPYLWGMETQTQSRKLRTCLWIVNQLRIHHEGRTLVELNNDYVRNEDLSHGQPLHRNSLLNYKAAILDLLGIDIACNMSTYRYYIDLEATNELSDWLINSFSLGQLVREQSDVRDRILLENTPQGMRFFNSVVDAIRSRTALNLTYQKFADTEPYTCRLEPYSVKLDEGRWYILGRKNQADHLQTFAFDRVLELSNIEGDHYELTLPFDPQNYYRDSFGVFTSPDPEPVVIHVYGTTYHYLHTKPLHHSQQEELLTDTQTPMEERVWKFSYYIRPSVDFKNELLRWGPGVKVISPAHFRDEIAHDIQRMAEQYRD